MRKFETSNIFLYGKGVFTTVSIVSGGPVLWPKHWQRLAANAMTVGIDLSGFGEQAVFERLNEKIAEDVIFNGRARLTFSDEEKAAIWRNSEQVISNTRLHITTGISRTIPDVFKLTVSSYPVNSRSPLAGVKSCNYLENLMALDEAKARGFHEAIRVNERGEVTSAAMANLFWLKDGMLFTPSLATGCLAGTTREFVMESLDCREVEVGIEELNSADAIYLTSAGLGIVAAAEFDGRKLDGPPNQITKILTR